MGVELVTNGSMEADDNWANYTTPTTNEISTTQKHGGTYSRKFIADSQYDGIQSDPFTTVSGTLYTVNAWVYPDTTTTVMIGIRNGDDSGQAYIINHSGLTQDAWNKISFSYTEGAGKGGNGAFVGFISSDPPTGTWYVDDVSIRHGTPSSQGSGLHLGMGMGLT